MRKPTLATALILATALCVPARAARVPYGCNGADDPAGDQVIAYAVTDTSGRGLPSLDVTRLQASMTRDGFTLMWKLSDLQRPVPGQSFVYRFSFKYAEQEFIVVASMQAVGEPRDTVLTDRFVLSAAGDIATAATAEPVPLTGSFDFAKHTIELKVTARDLGRADTSNYTISNFDAYTAQVVGNTLGLPADEASLASNELRVGTRAGC